MKKFIIPIVLAAALGIGGGIAVSMLNKPVVADRSEELPEVKTGNYYLNGDKDCGIYFELTDDYLALRIEKSDPIKTVVGYVKNDNIDLPQDVLAELDTEGDDEADYGNAKRLYDDYSAENPYIISVFGTENTPFHLMIHWDKNSSGPTYGGTGFSYNGIDRITSHPFGDFILVED